jgi:uncharacterized protein YjbI with pentapeptide repeats
VDWTDCEFVGRDFRDDDLSRLHTERVVFTECDFSGADIAQALAYAAAHGLRMDSERDR